MLVTLERCDPLEITISTEMVLEKGTAVVFHTFNTKG